MGSRSVSLILWTLVCVNSLTLVVGGLTTWLGYAIPARLIQFGLLPELVIVAGFASLIVASVALCALNYSSHHALNIYGISCTIFLLMLLFGIPQAWYRSGHYSQSNLVMNIMYFSLLVILSILLVFAFLFANHLKRKEQEADTNPLQLSESSPNWLASNDGFRFSANGSTALGCSSPSCNCRLNSSDEIFTFRSTQHKQTALSGSRPSSSLGLHRFREKLTPWKTSANHISLPLVAAHDQTACYLKAYQLHCKDPGSNHIPETPVSGCAQPGAPSGLLDQRSLISQYPLTHKSYYKTGQALDGTNRVPSRRACSSTLDLNLSRLARDATGRLQPGPGRADIEDEEDSCEDEDESRDELSADARLDENFAQEVPMILSLPEKGLLRPDRARRTFARSNCRPSHALCRHRRRPSSRHLRARDDSSICYGSYQPEHELIQQKELTRPVSSTCKSPSCRCNYTGGLMAPSYALYQPSTSMESSNAEERNYSKAQLSSYAMPMSKLGKLGEVSRQKNRPSMSGGGIRSKNSSSVFAMTAAAAAAALFGGVESIGIADGHADSDLFTGNISYNNLEDSALVDNNDCNNTEICSSPIDTTSLQATKLFSRSCY